MMFISWRVVGVESVWIELNWIVLVIDKHVSVIDKHVSAIGKYKSVINKHVHLANIPPGTDSQTRQLTSHSFVT